MYLDTLKNLKNNISSVCEENAEKILSELKDLDLDLSDAKDPISFLVKLGHKIYLNRQLENFKNFILEIDHGLRSEKSLNEKISELNNSKILNEDITKLLSITTEYDNTIKSILLGKLYVNFLRRKMSKKELFRLANLLNNFIIDDMDLLHYIVKDKPTEPEQVDDDSALNRLSSLGLINQPISIWAKVTDGEQPPLYYLLNDGKLLYHYSIKEYLDENSFSAE